MATKRTYQPSKTKRARTHGFTSAPVPRAVALFWPVAVARAVTFWLSKLPQNAAVG